MPLLQSDAVLLVDASNVLRHRSKDAEPRLANFDAMSRHLATCSQVRWFADAGLLGHFHRGPRDALRRYEALLRSSAIAQAPHGVHADFHLVEVARQLRAQGSPAFIVTNDDFAAFCIERGQRVGHRVSANYPEWRWAKAHLNKILLKFAIVGDAVSTDWQFAPEVARRAQTLPAGHRMPPAGHRLPRASPPQTPSPVRSVRPQSAPAGRVPTQVAPGRASVAGAAMPPDAVSQQSGALPSGDGSEQTVPEGLVDAVILPADANPAQARERMSWPLVISSAVFVFSGLSLIAPPVSRAGSSGHQEQMPSATTPDATEAVRMHGGQREGQVMAASPTSSATQPVKPPEVLSDKKNARKVKPSSTPARGDGKRAPTDDSELREDIHRFLERQLEITARQPEFKRNADGTYDVHVRVAWRLNTKALRARLQRYFDVDAGGGVFRNSSTLVIRRRNNRGEQLFDTLVATRVQIVAEAGGHHRGVLTIAAGRSCHVSCRAGDDEYHIMTRGGSDRARALLSSYEGEHNPIVIKSVPAQVLQDRSNLRFFARLHR